MHEHEDVLFEEQRALGQEIEAEPVMGVQLDPTLQQKVEAALEHLQTLADLRATIKAEGVSSHDITSLRSVHAALESIGLDVPASASLESYGALFTPTRTSLNLRVSNEAIGEAIMKTIKEWLRVLIDYIAKGLRWLKSLTMADEVIAGRVTSINATVTLLESNWKRMVATNSGRRDLTAKYLGAAEVCLTDPKLPRSDLGLLAFGVSDDAKRVRQIIDEAMKYGGLLLKQITDVRSTLEGKRHIWDFDSHVGPRLYSLSEVLRNMDVQSDDPNFYVKHKDVGIRFFEDTKRLQKREVYSYKFIYDLYGKCADELRKVNRFDFDEAKVPATMIQSAIASVNEGIGALNAMVDVLHKLPLYQFKCGASYANFFIQAHDICQKDFREHFVEDKVNEAFEATVRKFEEIKRSLGV